MISHQGEISKRVFPGTNFKTRTMYLDPFPTLLIAQELSEPSEIKFERILSTVHLSAYIEGFFSEFLGQIFRTSF